jgi:drug/metabolite transporter (DMT)-like permease
MALALGVLLALAGTTLINYSNYLMKRELAYLPRIGSQSAIKTIRAFLSYRPWLQAQGMQISGTFAHGIAVGLAPLSIVQPINAAGICLLVLLAVTRLKEKASLVDWIGISAIILGVMMLGITLVNTTGKTQSYRPVILWFFIVLLVGVVAASLTAAFMREDDRASSFLGIAIGVLVGLTAIFMKMGWTDAGNRWGEFRLAAPLFSSYFWLAIITTIIAAVLFQIALQRGSAIVVVPLVTGFSNLIPIIVGLVAFREPFPTGGPMAVLRLLSVLFIIGGAILLSLRREGGASKKVYTESSERTVLTG